MISRSQLLPTVALASFIVAGAACAQPAPQAGTTRTVPASPPPQQARFIVVFSPLARADTYLLDSQTGRIWQSVQDREGRSVWQEMRFVDQGGQPTGPPSR